MPGVNASGNIFNLGADAGFDDGPVSGLSGRVGSGVRLDYTARVEACHGIGIEASAKASAQAHAVLRYFIPGLRADGHLLAAAGVAGRLEVQPDIFDTFGLCAKVEARAAVAAAGRLAIIADFAEIGQAAQQWLTGAHWQLFAVFLEELSIEAGVWAEAAAAAMAEAHIEIAGSLADDTKSGFTISTGAKVGWGAGVGVEGYAAARLTNPRRWYDRSVRILTAEVASAGYAHLERDDWHLLEWFELTIPAVMSAVYEIGQQAAMSTLAPVDSKAETFLTAFMSALQRVLLAKVAEFGQAVLAELVDDLGQQVLDMDLDRSTLTRMRNAINVLLHALNGEKVTVTSFASIADEILELVAIARTESTEPWQRALATLWTALAAAATLGETVGTSSAWGGVIGTETVRSASRTVLLPDHSQMRAVEREYARFFGPHVASRLSLSQGIDYLLYAVRVQDALLEALPHLAPPLSRLAIVLGATEGDVVATLLLAAYERPDRLPLYEKLRTFFKDSIDNELLPKLVTQLESALPDSSDARIYLAEVVRPSLTLISTELFSNLDRFVRDGPNPSTFLEPFRKAAGLVVYKLAARNVVVLSDIFMNMVRDRLEDALNSLAKSIRDGRRDNMVSAAMESFLPLGISVLPGSEKAVRSILSELMEVAADANGASIWTDTRRRRFRNLLERVLLSIDGDVDYQDGDAVAGVVRELAECLTIPAIDEVINLNRLQLEVLQEQFLLVSERLVPITMNGFALVGEAILRGMEETAAAVLGVALDALNQAEEALQEAIRELERWSREVDRLARLYSDNLQNLEDVLKKSSTRKSILNKIRDEGIEQAKDIARNAPGYSHLSGDLKKAAKRLAVNAFLTAWTLTEPAIDGALGVLADLSGDVGALIDGARDLRAMTEELGDRISRDVKKALKDALDNSLANWLSFQSMADTAASYITGLPVVKDALKEAEQLRKDREGAEGQKAQAAEVEGSRRAIREAKKGDHRRLVATGPLSVVISEPAQGVATPRKVYPLTAPIPLKVTVEGATPTFVQLDATRRVCVAVNGTELQIPGDAWKYSSTNKVLTLSTAIRNDSHGLLRAGINVLECSVTSGEKTSDSAMLAFLVSLGDA